MLIAFSEKITGWLATIITSLLIFSFALWGVNFYFTPERARNIAKINDQLIPLQNYQRALYNKRQQIKSLLGGDAIKIDDTFIKEQTLKQIIDSEIINQVVDNEGLQVSDSSIRAAIENIRAFQREEGQFDRTLYRTSLLNYGMDPAYFEKQLRLDMLSEQLRDALARSLFVTDKEIEQVVREKQQQRTISYTILSASSYLDDIEVSEQDTAAFYNAHTQEYMEPEQVQIAFIELDMKRLLAEVHFEESDLRTYYNKHKDQFIPEERRSVKQLVAKIGKNATEEQRATAKLRIEQAKKQIDQGKTMEEVIKFYNEEGISNLDFNEYRAIKPGVMQAEIDAFLFTASEGDISKPIETKEGLHIVQLDAIEQGLEDDYEGAREKVIKEYRRTQAEAQFFEQFDTIATLSYEHQDTLQPASSATGLEIQESDFFSEQDKKGGILAERKIIDASFSDQVKNNGINSDVIELSDTHAIVLRVVEQKAARLKPLTEVNDQVVEDMKNEWGQQKIEELSKEILAQLEEGRDETTIAAQYHLKWIKKEGIKKNDLDVNRVILRTAFSMDEPKQGARYRRIKIGANDYAVIALTDIEHISSEQLDNITAQKRKTIRTELIQDYARSEWEQLLSDIKENSDIEIYSDNI